MARTVNFLPEIFRTPTNEKILRATLDQLVQEPTYKRAEGFIGRRYGPGQTVEDKYIVEEDKTRKDYQLEPATIFLEPGSKRTMDALTYPGYIDALTQELSPTSRPDLLFEEEYYVWDPFVDYDKFVNYNLYYWVYSGPSVIRLTAPTSAVPFDPGTAIVGAQTYDTSEGVLEAPASWAPNTVKFTNGLKVLFTGNITAGYKDIEYYVEGVGTEEGIQLLPVENFAIPEIYNYPLVFKREDIPWDQFPWDTTLWDGSRLVPGSDIDYITINRASRDLNAWTRANRWFHVDVLRYTADILGQTLVLDDAARGRRPILEFRRDLQLFNTGKTGLDPISVIDYSSTNPFGQVAGKQTYSVDGVDLFAGMRIIFAAADDPVVAAQVYLVEQITPVPGQPPLLYLSAIAGQVATEGSQTVCKLGSTQQGRSFYLKNGTWVPAQLKTAPNQPPLFDLYDRNGVSFSDTLVYPGTTFAGSKLFSYTPGEGAADTILRFPIRYRSVGNIGDILFDYNIYKDTFTYESDLTIITQSTGKGFAHYNVTAEVSERLTGYQTATLQPNVAEPTALLSQQPQVFEFDYQSGDLVLDIAVLQQDDFPDITNITQIYVNDTLIDPSLYTVTLEDANNRQVYPTPAANAGQAIKTRIEFALEPEANSLIVCFALSEQVSKTAYYQVPTNLSKNALNADITEITLGTVRDHYVTICQNISAFEGVPLASNNTRDLGNIIPYGVNLIQHSAALPIPAVTLREPRYNFWGALTYNSKEYQKYKDQLLDFVWKNEFVNETTATILNSAIDGLKANRSDDSPFYWSAAITAGVYESSTYTWLDGSGTTFDLLYTYDYSQPNYTGINVYINDSILCRDRDYVVDTVTNTITIQSDLLSDGDVVQIDEYTQTFGNFVPATPSSLRLFPAYYPEIYVDTTYSTPTTVIRGHDGSITPAFGDYRDQVLLEFETRIYSNIKGAADFPLDYHAFLPGAFRTGEYSDKAITDITTLDFVEWLGANKIDYKQQDFNANNQFSWNYGQSSDKLSGAVLAGYWRQIYRYYYDTDEPQNYPWQMLGFSNKPLWWDETYGSAPYTAQNLVLWEDLASGTIREPGNTRIDSTYARPGLLSIIPVDDQGNLLSPFAALVAGYNPATWATNWMLDTGSPAQSAFEKSSYYPFAVLGLLASLKPAQFFSYYIDRALYKYDDELNQWLYDGRGRLVAADVEVYGTGLAKNSYLNFIVEYLKSYGLEGTAQLKERFENLDIRLTYRVAGFTDKRYLKLLSDRGSPQSSNKSLLIPDENYDVLLYRNQIFNNINFSAVTVEVTDNGFAVYGNSLSAPYFRIIPTIINNNFISVDIGPTNVRFYKDFSDEELLIPYGYTFRNINAVVDFIISYGEYLRRQGFINKTVENTVLLNWTQMAQEVVYWYNQGWSAGSLIQVNPAAGVIEFERAQTVVTNLLENRREDVLTNQNRLALTPRDYVIDRIANNFKITSLNENNLGFLNIKLTSYEHLLVIDNVTDFNDLIYDQFTGLRQSRLLYNGIKSGDWNGTLDAPGFIINLPNIQDWDDNTSYSKGEMVRFKNLYYQANQTVDASTEFNYDHWTQVRFRPDQEGMLPNLALKAKQSTEYYDQHAYDLNEDANLLGYGITGFRPYDWMASIELDTVSQVNGYLEFVRRKGTPGAIDYYNNAQISNDTLTYTYYENWAIQRATYGATATNAYIQLVLDASKLGSNPATVALVELGQTSDADQKTPVTEVYDSSFVVTSSDVLPTISGYLPDQGLPSAGYVQSDDVEVQLFSIDDNAALNAQLDAINQDTEIWVAKANAVDWMVYKCQSIGITLTAISDNLNGQALFLFDGNHGLQAGQRIIVKEFDAAVNGVYVVSQVTSTNSVLVDFIMPPGSQILLGSGIVFSLADVRVAQPSDIADLSIEYQLRANNKVWVDNNGFGRWSVINKQLTYGNLQTADQGNTNGRFGSSIAVTADDEHILVGAPGLYTNGAVVPYYNANGVYTAQDPIVIPSSWSTSAGRVYKNLGERSDAAGDEWSAFSITWGPTANVSTYANVALFSQSGNSFNMRWMFGAGTANRNFTGQIKFSEDRDWLYVSNPDARAVTAYQRVPYQQQSTVFEADGETTNYPVSDVVRVTNGAQFSVRINTETQTWLQDYNATTNIVTFAFPPPAPQVIDAVDYAVNTANVVVSSITGIAVGQRVTGIGLDAETYVKNITTNIVDNNFIYTITLDKMFSASARNASLTFINQIHIGRWDTNPDTSYWPGDIDPTIARGGQRVFTFGFLAGATGFQSSVGVYLNDQFMRVGEDYNYNYLARNIQFRNFSPPDGSRITFVAKDYWREVGTITGSESATSWGTGLAINGDGTVIAVGEPRYDRQMDDNDGRFVVYNRGLIDHKVSNTSIDLYTTPVAIQGLPQVWVNNRPLTEDTDINFGEFVYETDDPNSAVYTGNSAIRLNNSVVANLNIGDIVTISYNTFDFLQDVTNPDSALTNSEFGYSLSMDRLGTAITAGAPNGNTGAVAGGFAARIVDRAQLYGEITGTVENPTVASGSTLRINNFLVDFSAANISSISNTLPVSVSTGTEHGFYDGETVTISNVVSFGQTNYGNGSINNAYYVRPTSATTFLLYVGGNISNVLPTNPVQVVTDNATDIAVLDTVFISNVAGVSNVNSSTSATSYNPNSALNNPYWFARQANGNSATTVELYRAYSVYQFQQGTTDLDVPIVKAIIYADVEGISVGTPITVRSPAVTGAPALNNGIFYVGDVSLIGNATQSITALDLYYDDRFLRPVSPSTPGTTTDPNTIGSLLGVGIDGTGWGSYRSGGTCLKQIQWIDYGYTANTGTAYDNSLDGVIYTINQAEINNIIARRSGNSIQIQTVSSSAAPANQQLLIGAGPVSDACQQLGLEPYYSGAATQILGGSYPVFGARYGYNIDVEWSGQSVLIASEYGSAVASTTFDDDTTTFDSRTTRFDDVYAKSGAVDVYQLLPAADRSLENPDKFVWAQQLSDFQIRTGADWGAGISVTGNVMAVGSPGYIAGTDTQTNDGRIVIYTGKQSGFPTLREQPDIVDVYSLNEVTVFNSNSKVALNYLDFIDPLQGRILGAAQQNIDLISAVDPAKYNVGIDIDGVAWGPEQVGYIWWDVTNVRFLEYHTEDINAGAKIWGQPFPGSSIEVYQWVVSPVPPAQYAGPGRVLDTTNFCTYTTVSVTNAIVVQYYFWVQGLTQIADNKTLSIESIAQYIANPRSTGIAYMAALAPNTVALYNTNADIVANTSVLNISYDTIPQDNNIHIEYDLIQQDNPRQFMDDTTYAKFVDSLSGITEDGLPVPDPALGPGSRYGIQFRPRQTMFKDRFLALKNYIQFANTVLRAVPIVEEKSFDLLKSRELPPVEGEIDPDTGTPWWNVQVANLTELSYQSINTVPLGWRYLVDQDSDYNNFWTIYQVVENTAGVRSLSLLRVQSYNTNNYWRYINWYAEGYNPATRPLYTVRNYSDISELTIPDDGVVRVTQNNPTGYELYQNKVIATYRDDATGEWIVDTEIVRVGLENGTIEILSSVYDYSGEADKINPHYPYIETRKIVDSLNTEIYTQDLLIERSKSMSLMFNYILGEQVDCNWLYKTSLIDVSHPVRKLLPYRTYKPDNQDFVLGYINEVKPYHVLIKDFSLVYATVADLYPGDVTDFDVPATYFEEQGRYISPILDNSDSYGIYGLANTSPTWTTLPYRNWNSQYGLRIVEIKVIDGGSGYTITPAVTITGDSATPAQARAVIDSQGSVASIQITVPGGLYRWSADHIKVPNGFNPAIQVTIAAPDTPGTTAKAYAVTTPAPVRNFTTVQKFNRMNLQPSFGYWSANISYQQGDIVKFSNAAYRSRIDYNQSPEFNFDYWDAVPPEELEGVDRTFAYYRGAAGEPGEDALDQLITGLTYPGVVTKRKYLGTWDTSPWSSDPYESDRGRLQAIYNGGTYLDSTLGSLPWSVVVEGGAYIDTYSSHAPEELVPGSTFDTLDLTVNTIPGQDDSNAGFSSPIGGVEYIIDPDSSTQTYSFADAIKYPYAIAVHATDADGNRIRLYETVDSDYPQDYTIDWVSQTITLEPLPIMPPPYTLLGGRMLITVYGLGGGNQLLRSTGIRDVQPNGNIIVPIAFTNVNPNLLPLYVNGNALVLGTDYTISSYFPNTPDDNDIAPATRINFSSNLAPVSGARVDYTVFGIHSTLAQSGYSIPEVQLWTNITGEIYTATAAGSPGYVAVGLDGEVAFSSDSVIWTKLVAITEEDLLSVEYGNGVFLASAADGRLYSSTDGQNWELVATGPGIAFHRIRFVDSRFYGFGAGNQVYVSDTGDSWQQVYIDNTAPTISSVASYNSEITALRIVTRGFDFPSVPTNVLFADGGNSAQGANATVTLTLVGATVNTEGANYLVGDQISISGGVFSTQAQAIVTRLANTTVGNVAEVAVTTGGDYTTLPPLAASTTGGNGTGLVLNIDCGVNTITLQNRGRGYTETPTIVLQAGNANIGQGYNIVAVRDTMLIAVGGSNTYKFDSTLGTTSWQRASANVPADASLNDIAYNAGDGNLIAVGYDTANSISLIDISLTANSGWSNLAITGDYSNTANLLNITALDTSGGYATVITTDLQGVVLYSANSSSWGNVSPTGNVDFGGFTYQDSTQQGVLVGNASAIYTTVDGTSWIDRTERELELENYSGGSNPIAGIVEINGVRLRGPHCVGYISDGVRNTYAVGYQRGTLNSTLTPEDVTVYVDDSLYANSLYNTQYSQIRDAYEVIFTEPVPQANSRIVLAVATDAVPYTIDSSTDRLILTQSVNDSDVIALTTWRDTREQNLLNRVFLGENIRPVNQDASFSTYASWTGASNVLTLGSQTQGQWSNIGLWYDYEAFGSGVNVESRAANYSSNSQIITLDTDGISVGQLVQGVGIPGSTFVTDKTAANITISQLPLGDGNSNIQYSNSQLSFFSLNVEDANLFLSLGNTIVVEDGSGASVDDFVFGTGIPYGTYVTGVKPFVNSLLQTNYAIKLDRDIQSNGYVWNRKISNTESNIYGVSASNYFVAVDSTNNIFYSRDGSSWSYVDPVALLPLRAIAYGLIGGTGTYVAVGRDGSIVRSTDSVNWTQEGYVLTARFNSVAYGVGAFVAVGDAGVVYYSPDTLNWTQASIATTDDLQSIIYTGSEFLVTGAAAQVFVSSDTVNWTRRYLNYVDTVTVTAPGGDYRETPTVTFDPPYLSAGITAEALAVLSGGIQSLSLTSAGANYTYAPNVSIVQNANTGAAGATASMQNFAVGAVTYIAVVEGGEGYNTAPTVSFTSTTVGTGATAVAQITGDQVTGIIITNGGSGYSVTPGDTTVTITPAGGDIPTTPAAANCTVTSSIALINITAAGSDYTNYDQGNISANGQPTASTPQVIIENFRLDLTSGPDNIVSGNTFEVSDPTQLVLGMQITADVGGAGYIDLGRVTSIAANVITSNIADVAYAGALTPATPLRFIDGGTGADAEFRYFDNASVANIWLYQRGSGYEVEPNIAISFPFLSSNVATATCTIAPVTTGDLQAVSLIGSTYIAAGKDATVITSRDNITWFANSAGVVGNINTALGTEDGSNVYLLAGEDGNLFRSTNLQTTWTQVSSNISANIHQGLAGDGNLVIVADGGIIITSSAADGNNWSNAASNASNDLYGIVYTGSEWAVVGSHSTILTTSNIASWITREQEWPLNDSAGGVYGIGNRYVLVGDNGTLYQSIGNGTANAPTHWTRYDSGTVDDLQAVAYGAGIFVAVGNNTTVTRSTDGGVTWTANGLGQLQTLRAVDYYAPLGFIAAGENGTIYTSATGVGWNSRTSGTTANLNAVVGASVGNTMRIVAAGEDGVISTSVTDAFSTETYIVAGAGSNTQVNASGNTFSAALTTNSSHRVSVTVDGVELTPAEFAVTSIYPNVTVRLANTLSGNTLNITTTAAAWRGVTYGAEIFALVGDDGTYWNSSDGISWLPIDPITSTNLRSIAYRASNAAASLANTFVSVGDAAGWQYSNSTSGYIATSTTGNLIPITFAPNFDAISPGMLVTGDYILTNTLVEGKDYAQRLLYVDQAQPNIAPVESRNIQITFTPTLINNSYDLGAEITNAYRPWITVDGEYEIINTDWAAEGRDADIIANAFSVENVVQILDSSYNSVPDELAFKVWKDMNDNTAVYRQNSFNTTVLAQLLLPEDDSVYLADVTKLQAPILSDNILGVCFVGAERINFRYIDYAANRIYGLLRGTAGTSVMRHEVGTVVSDASLLNTIPSRYRDQFRWQDFRGDGITVDYQCTTLTAAEAEQVQVISAGLVIPTRTSSQLADGNSTSYIAEIVDTAGNVTGEIYVDRYSQVLVAAANTLLTLTQQVFLGNNASNNFVANSISTASTANIIVAVNNVVIPVGEYTATLNAGNVPNVTLGFVPDNSSEVKIAVDYLVTDLSPVTIAFAQAPAANTMITIAADFYTSALSPIAVTFAEPPLANTTLRIGIDQSQSWYDALGDGIRLQSQQTLAAEFLRGSA